MESGVSQSGEMIQSKLLGVIFRALRGKSRLSIDEGGVFISKKSLEREKMELQSKFRLTLPIVSWRSLSWLLIDRIWSIEKWRVEVNKKENIQKRVLYDYNEFLLWDIILRIFLSVERIFYFFLVLGIEVDWGSRMFFVCFWGILIDFMRCESCWLMLQRSWTLIFKVFATLNFWIKINLFRFWNNA